MALPQTMALRAARGELEAFIDNLLLKHWDWITRQVTRQLSYQSAHQPENRAENPAVNQTGGANPMQSPCSSPASTVPEYLELPATGERITVDWNNQSGRNAYCLMPAEDEHPVRLVLSTKNSEGDKAAVMLLRTWVKDYALRVFEPQLRRLADEAGFVVHTVKTRLQRTRLGSCTRLGVISLNAAMLFFPPELVRHLMFHELCHLREMNHGPGFWKLLLALDAQSLKNDKALKRAMRSVPGWLFRKLEN